MKEGYKKFLTNLTLFTKIVSRCVQWSSSFAETFLHVREACKYIDNMCGSRGGDRGSGPPPPRKIKKI